MKDAQQLVTIMQQALDNGAIYESIKREAADERAMSIETFVWTLEQLRLSVGGVAVGPLSNESVTFTSVSTDSRQIVPGALYIAIKGEQFDGHEFIEEAVRQGAVAVLVSEAVETVVPGIAVDDTRIALGQFAHWHRQQMPVKTLVGITGSNGKTTTKSLLAEMFSAIGSTLATQGNLNNDFGVPRTLLELRPEHEFAVIEMGASHQGEIEYLTKLVEPDIALINNASDSHLEGFGSLEGVIEAKGEVFLGLNRLHQNGVAVINTDSPGFADWQAQLESLAIDKVVTFGEVSADFEGQAGPSNVVFREVTAKAGTIEFELMVDGVWQLVNMPVLGRHNAANATACTAVGFAAGLTWQQIKPVLEQFTGVAGRLQRHKILNGWLLDDTYNANPGSVKAGIQALVSLPGKVAVCLGPMAELGSQAQLAHDEIAEYANHAGVSRLYVCGEATKGMPKSFGIGATWYKTHALMIEDVILAINQEWVSHVLVKGSRSANMEVVVKGLLEDKP